MLAYLNPVNAGLLSLLLANVVSCSPITPITSIEQLFHQNNIQSMLPTQNYPIID